MIQIDNLYFKFELNDLTINNIEQFQSLKIKESCFGEIPSFELELKFTDYEFLKDINYLDELDIYIGFDEQKLQKLNFLIINKTFYQQGNRDYRLILSGITNIKYFITNTKQEAYNDTLINVIKKIQGVKIISELNSNDKQIWIRNNETEKQFFNKSIPYMNLESSPIYGINYKNELHIKDIKKELEKEEKIKLSISDKNTILINSWRLETDNAYSYFLSDGKQQPIIDIISKENIYYNNTESSKNIDFNNYNFSPIINCGNTYKEYYQVFMKNISNWTEFSRNNLFLTLRAFLIDDTVTLTDNVFIKIDSNDSFSLNGNYLITEKIFIINKESVSTIIKCNRI